jgi:hypothetical protein
MKNEIENLTKQLGEKERDLEILKKQAGQQHEEYNRIADKINEIEGQGSSESKKSV